MSQVENATGGPGGVEVYVWQAPQRIRMGVTAVCALLVLLSAWIISVYGVYAVIGVGLVLALVVRTWWMVLRPRITAGRDGVRVVSGRTPVDLSWAEIRRVEAHGDGLKIVCSGGREVRARYPQQPPRALGVTTEAEAVAAFLAQRAAWARKPTGAEPSYVAPPPPKRG
jgi:hypothetical protein